MENERQAPPIVTVATGQREYILHGSVEELAAHRLQQALDATFELRSVGDIFRAVREEDVGDFLTDLGIVLCQYHAMRHSLGDALQPLESFIWVRDGKHHTDVVLRPDGEEGRAELEQLCEERLTRLS